LIRRWLAIIGGAPDGVCFSGLALLPTALPPLQKGGGPGAVDPALPQPHVCCLKGGVDPALPEPVKGRPGGKRLHHQYPRRTGWPEGQTHISFQWKMVNG
jgi:hypothetical protein